MSDINIVFACDKNYTNFLATAMASILKNSNSEDSLHFYILDGGIPSLYQDKILSLKTIKDFSIQFIRMDYEEELEKCYIPSGAPYPKVVYFRFFIANILDKLDKVLYLDVDIIAQSSLSELYEIDLSNSYIAASPDLEIGMHKALSRLKIYGHSYFNSGVLLINLKKWREDKISEQLVSLSSAMKDKIHFPDQDVLNVLFYNNYVKIGQEWNCNSENALNLPNVKIIHYMGNMKFNFESSYLLHEYIALTPFKSFKSRALRLPSKQDALVLVKKLIRKFVAQEHIGNTLVHLASYIIHEREKISVKNNTKVYTTGEQLFIEGAVKHHSSELKVLNGEFKGLQYIDALLYDSEIFPKILGSYELELSEVIKKIIADNPQTIVDIACADGYYAVALATRCPSAQIYAFDANVESQRLCFAMATANNVEKRIVIDGECTEQHLLAISNVGRGIIICDCNSAGKNTISKNIFAHFSNFYFLLKIQDYFDIALSTYIRRMVEVTHEIIIINTSSDVAKAITCSYEELASYSLELKKVLLAENKSERTVWFYLRPKHKE